MRPDLEPLAPLRTCVTCRHTKLNPPANFPLACYHPSSEHDPVSGYVATCRQMRSLTGKCGPHADLWDARPVPKRLSILRLAWRAITGEIT